MQIVYLLAPPENKGVVYEIDDVISIWIVFRERMLQSNIICEYVSNDDSNHHR